LGKTLQSLQSEETLRIQQHSQVTDSEKFNIDVTEYIIREQNDEQVKSDGIVAWKH